MFCTRCGTENSEDSKYCRECGSRLVDDSSNLELRMEQPTAPIDETLLAELLHDTLKHYERYELDEALAKCREALTLNPGSPSGHSLLALIYEKKAEQQRASGDPDAARDSIRSAIRQLERVIDANPGSIADRNKLEELRMTLSDPAIIRVKKNYPVHERVVNYFRRVPLQWTASAGAFVILFAVLALALRDNKPKNPGTQPVVAPPQSTQMAENPRQTFQPQNPQATQPSVQQPAQPGQPMQTPQGPAWSNQPQQVPNTGATQVPQQQNYAAAPQPQYTQPSAAPVPGMPQIPSIDPYPVEPPQPVIAPVPPKKTRPSKPPTQNIERVVMPPAPKTVSHPSESARDAYAREDYEAAARLYEQAIGHGENTAENHQELGMCLYNLNKNSAASSNFQQAIQMYGERKAKGIDTASADSGIRTCKSYLAILKD